MERSTGSAVHSLLWPSSVAVIGADDDLTKMNGASVRNLLDFGFKGRIFPVTPHHRNVYGVPCHADLSTIEGVIDTAVIVVRAERSLEWLERCVDRGIGSATIVGAGFSEGAAKASGEALTRRLKSIVSGGNIRVLGPNTAGLINLRHQYAPRAAFNHFPPHQTVTGDAAIVCQSGAISNILYNKCQANGVGVAYSVATGDQIDMDVWDFIDYALSDEAVAQILCVVEGYRDARRFVEVANRAAACRKPIILLKLGRSEAGARMVATHSGSMAGAYRTFQTVSAQAGIIEADDFDQFWELAALFGAWGAKPAAAGMGRKSSLGAFAISGGDAAFIADEAESSSLEMPSTSTTFDDAIDSMFAFASGGNPFDCTGEVLGNPELLEVATKAFITDNQYDYILIAAPVFKTELATKLYPRIVAGTASQPARVAVSAWAAGSLTDAGIAIFRSSGMPVFDQCGRAVRAIDRYDAWMRGRSCGVDLAFAPSERSRADPFYADLKLELAAAGVPFTEGYAVELAGNQGLPGNLFDGNARFVLKMNCRSQLHKSAAGLVKLGIGDMSALQHALDAMPRGLECNGWVLERQMRSDLEVYVGGTSDPDFGKALLVGFGGRFAEHLGGNSMWVGRYSGSEFSAWLARTPVGQALNALDSARFKDLVSCVEAAGAWFLNSDDVTAFDLNPVLVDLADRRLCAVDCRVF